MNVIIDTGWIVGFLNRQDQHHKWAEDYAARIDFPALVCESVLAESVFRANAPAVLSLIESGILKIAFRIDEHQLEISKLANTYQDRAPGLADLCVIRMSEIFRQRTVLTVDHDDFSVYRRNRFEKIPFRSPKN